MKKLIKDIIVCIIIVIFTVLISRECLDKPNESFEIERKWLINLDEVTLDLEEAADKYEITQTYIHYSPEIRVRKIEHELGHYYTMTVKRYVNDKGLTREEFDFEITEAEYNNTVVKGLDNTINKTRYQIQDGKYLYAFDIFHGDLDGLVYMEVEFNSESDAKNFKEPDWVVKDITDDRRYKNQSLAQFGIPQE